MAQNISSPRRVLAALILLMGGYAAVAQAQTTETAIRDRLVGKELYLRGFWIENKLNFDSSGILTKPSRATPFTMSGMDVEKVTLTKDGLKLGGPRRAIVIDKTGAHRTRFWAGEIAIFVATPPDGDFGPALDKVFIDGLEAVKPLLPAYWQPLAKRNFVPVIYDKAHPLPPTNLLGMTIKEIGGHVLPPKILGHHPNNFTGVDRAFDSSGKVLVSLVIGTSGKILEYQLVEAAGLGRDEEALFMIGTYMWQPATEDGVPVAVQMEFEMDFPERNAQN